ncbi:hypothetical protein [Spirosoma validum]|uniref:Uncharacterized protein n=1 Tax=Spirosoma validum TaxID=2771355 RepID=A0A927B4S2_9BACT|nr:hypothetical protein [Spirosoma validum]MBD2755187.1 hypothetical protein [Spirosoma validum]
MKEYQLKDIYSTYVPSERECVILLSLYQRIEAKQIEKYFTHETFKEVVREVYESDLVRVEDILRGLLDQFIEASPKRYDGKRYTLTHYANTFIKLIFNQLNNLRNKYSLAESFDQFAQLNAESINTYDELECWYQLSFSDSASQTINDHVGGLNAQLKEYLKQLTDILRNDQQTIGNKIGAFVDVFQHFSAKALDVQKTLQLRHNLFFQLTIIVDRFYDEFDNAKQADSDQLMTKKTAYECAKNIRDEVRNYFNQIEDRLSLIIDKIQFAEEKLTELQGNFREYARFRINLRKLLNNFLFYSEYDKDFDTRFTMGIPAKDLINGKNRFIEVEKHDFGVKTSRSIFIPARDATYFNWQQNKIHQQLAQQESISNYVSDLLNTLSKEGYLDLSKHFWQIYDQNENLEMAVETCFSVINIVSIQKECIIKIDKTLQSSFDNLIGIWQMTITKI